ncbi:MAG TPA: zf-HC2 domain-containing protein [Ignavibacteria bacterium]|jgi:hypothetical protein
MKFENLNMKSNICKEVQLLIEDYLDGMISTENKKGMEQHISSCNNCKAYLEYTVMLIDNTSLMSKQDRLSDEKKNQLWNNIESKINSTSSAGDTQIYNMSGLEDEYIPPRLTPSERTEVSPKWSSFRYYISGLAAVFALAFIIYVVSQFRQGSSNINVISTGIVETSAKWKVTPVKGSPMIDGLMMKAADSISLGEYIITDDSSRAELTVANLGTVTIEPKTKVRFVKSVEGEHRIELVYGTIDANILAKPRSFFVDAGRVTAVDLGCSYKISMDDKGDGLLYVKSGRVSLESAGGRESLVPEGKFCVLKKDIGPGTPFRGDTSPELKKALMDFDFGNCGGQCVNVILKNAKKKDAVTLINIIPLVDEEYKTAVYTKASNFVAPPKNFPKDSVQKKCNVEKLNEWVDKVMEEVHKNIEENMKIVEENIKNFDHEKWSKDWAKEWEKNFKNNWQFNYDTNIKYNFNFEVPSPEEMQELQQDLNEMQRDLQRDNEEFKKEMEHFKEEMQRVGEEIKRENIEKQREQEGQLRDMEQRQREKEERMREKQERQKEKQERMKEKHEKEDDDTPVPPDDNKDD